MFSYRQPLEALPQDEVSNVAKAIENAEMFTRELIDKISLGVAKQDGAS